MNKQKELFSKLLRVHLLKSFLKNKIWINETYGLGTEAKQNEACCNALNPMLINDPDNQMILSRCLIDDVDQKGS